MAEDILANQSDILGTSEKPTFEDILSGNSDILEPATNSVRPLPGLNLYPSTSLYPST